LGAFSIYKIIYTHLVFLSTADNERSGKPVTETEPIWSWAAVDSRVLA